MSAAARIGELAKEKGIALKELSRRVDIPYTTLYNAVKRDSKMDFETVQRIAAALGVPWNELYSANEEDEDVKAWAPDARVQTEDYKHRVDTAGAYLSSLVDSAEDESNVVWSVDSKNNWMKTHLPEVAKMFNINAPDLDDDLYWNYNENEKYLHDIHEAIDRQPIRFRSLEKICRALSTMTVEAQALAADRVEELAQIPKYQRPAGSPQDAPAGSDDKTPTEK